MDQWHYTAQGQSCGPCSIAQLRALAAEGKLHPADLVWRNGMPAWVPAASVPELGLTAVPAKAAAPAPPEAPAPRPAGPPPPGLLRRMLIGLHSLPKPILFGMYGALGALLGVLLLGELLWALLRPAPPEAVPLQVAVSPAVTAYYGGVNRFTIAIVRQGFDGPVLVRVMNLPEDVKAPTVTIPAGQQQATIELTVNEHPDARPPARAHALRVEASGRGIDGALASAELTLRVEPPPPRLYVSAPALVKAYYGGSNRFPVRIARQWFDGPVRLEPVDLPAALKVEPITLAAGRSDAEVVVNVVAPAAGTPARVEGLRLRAVAPDQAGLSAAAEVKVQAEMPPPRLALAASPSVRVYAGDKNRFGVKVNRQWFDGPVVVEAVDLPAGVTIAPMELKADQSEAELEVAVASRTPPRFVPLKLRARAAGRADVAAAGALGLSVERPPPGLSLAISSKIDIFQGGACKFGVKVARTGYDGPLHVTFEKLPEFVKLQAKTPHVYLPAGANEAEVELFAKYAVPVGKYPAIARVTAPGFGAPGATAQFDLEVKPSTYKPPVVDIMFVLDVTGSMSGPINGIRDGIIRFAEGLENEQLDVRVGLVAFRDAIADRNKEPFKVLMVGGKALTKDYAGFRTQVSMLKADGGGDTPESSYEGMVLATKQKFREKSTRILVLITDAPPKLVNGKTQAAANAASAAVVRALKGKNIKQVHLVINAPELKYYTPLQKNAKGRWFSLAEASKGRDGFAGLLPELGAEIVRTTVAERPETPRAVAPPPPPPAGNVASPRAAAAPAPAAAELPGAPRVDAVPPPPLGAAAEPPQSVVPQLQGVQSTEAFAEEDRYQLLLAIAAWTAALAAGIAWLLLAGQRFYLQGGLPGLLDSGKALVGGVVAGLIGGAVGQLIMQSSPGGTTWEVVSRVLGWGLLGAVAGLGMALLVPNLKWPRALLGGGFGGLAGALGFVACSLLLGGGPGRVLGAAIVGFCIGVMIALAELAFRRYWLEITYGAREVRTVTLGRAAVVVGGDEGQAAVLVRGAAPIALRYRVEGDRVLCEDAVTGRTIELTPGDQRELSGVRIAVCSATSARAVGIALRLSDGTTVALREGMPLTADDVPGLQASAADGSVALVSRKPSDPRVLLLRNRSKQTWTVTDAAGKRQVGPGLGVELIAGVTIDFGAVRGTLESSGAPHAAAAPARRPASSPKVKPGNGTAVKPGAPPVAKKPSTPMPGKAAPTAKPAAPRRVCKQCGQVNTEPGPCPTCGAKVG